MTGEINFPAVLIEKYVLVTINKSSWLARNSANFNDV